jgi:hypothetical protein
VSWAVMRNVDYSRDKRLLLVGTTDYYTQTENIKHFESLLLSECTPRMLKRRVVAIRHTPRYPAHAHELHSWQE